jgi:predicted transcriptional regulator
MNPEDLIETLATGSIDRLSILRTIQNGPMPKTEIADRCGVSRKTVGFVNDLDGILVKQSEEGYSLTGAGAIVIRKYDDARQLIGKDTLESLALSCNKRVYLRNLRSRPMTRDALSSHPHISNRSIVARIASDFSSEGYIARSDGGKDYLTESGKDVIDTYQSIIQTYEQVYAKDRCLEWLGTETENLPAAALADARMEVRRPGRLSNTMDDFISYILDADVGCTDRVCIMSSFSNNDFDEVLARFVEAGAQVDVLLPTDILRTYLLMDKEDLMASRAVAEPENVTVWLYDRDLPCNIVSIGDNGFVLAPSHPSETDGTFGLVFSSNSAVTRWGTELFDSYKADAPVRGGDLPRMVQMTKAGEYVESLDGASRTELSSSSPDQNQLSAMAQQQREEADTDYVDGERLMEILQESDFEMNEYDFSDMREVLYALLKMR